MSITKFPQSEKIPLLRLLHGDEIKVRLAYGKFLRYLGNKNNPRFSFTRVQPHIIESLAEKQMITFVSAEQKDYPITGFYKLTQHGANIMAQIEQNK